MAIQEIKKRPKQTVDLIKKSSTIKRYIHYYELLIGYRQKHQHDTKGAFKELLRSIIKENNEKTADSFFVYDGRTFCVQDLTIKDGEKIAYGKLCAIRSEDFPQMFNLRSGETRDLDAKEFEGLVEFSHFVINYNCYPERIAIEYNQYGGKILDFGRYLAHIGSNKDITDGVAPPKNVLNDSLSKVKNKIGRVSRFTAKVNSSNIESIRNMEPGLGTVLGQARDQFQLKDIKVEFKFDYSHRNSQTAINKAVDVLIGKFVKNPQQTDLFLKLTVDAENTERNNRIESFDLLMDKVRSELKATKDGKNRTIVSNEIIDNIITEMKKLNL